MVSIAARKFAFFENSNIGFGAAKKWLSKTALEKIECIRVDESAPFVDYDADWIGTKGNKEFNAVKPTLYNVNKYDSIVYYTCTVRWRISLVRVYTGAEE